MVFIGLSTASWLAIASGCTRSHEVASDPDATAALSALMQDGPLPAGMMSSGDIAPPPPRFCEEEFFSEPDGGVDEPPMAGVSGSAGVSAGGFGGSFGGMAGVGGVGVPVGGMAAAGAPGGEGGGTAGTGGTAGMTGVGGAAGTDGMAGSGVAGMSVGGAAGAAGDPGGDFGSCESTPIGFWRFDDCNTERTDLQDSANAGHAAFRSVDLRCTEGQEGQAISISAAEDLVYVPDQPAFALSEGVTVAAWVNPNRVDRPSTIFRKRDDANSAFTLMIQGRRFQFIVKLSSGRMVSVSAPATARRWTHVAATYDGAMLRLYLDGIEASSAAANGTLVRGVGPLLMGNDISQRKLDGLMDNAWFNTLAAPADTILQLTCLSRPATLSVSPEVSEAVAAGTTVPYELSITNNNTAVCAASSFASFIELPAELSSDQFFLFTEPLESGETGTVQVDVTSNEEAEPGSYPVTFRQFSFFGEFAGDAQVTAQYVVAEPTGCFVRSSRELTVRDVSVVDDEIRTSMDGDPEDPRTGAWAFGRLMERLSPSVEDAPDVTEDMFRTFLEPQSINSFTIESREALDFVVLQPWPRTANGKLDLARSPLRLLAIVNRLDLKDLAHGKAGEGRFVYGVLDESGFPLEFTVILEYMLPGSTEAEHAAWAHSFHALKELPFPSEEYNAALQAITDRFTARDAMSDTVNGSALIDIRTNEIALSFQWELREFRLSPTTGFLDPVPVFQTPDQSFNFSEKLGRFINENEASIVAETHEAPLSFEGAPFGGASVFNNIDFWDAPGVVNPEARHKLSLNTCNGCHGAETNTTFLQVGVRFPGEQSTLSPFLTGTTVFDPATGEPRRLAELSRRRGLLEAIVCAP